jgi:hypothetical protein
VSGEGIDEELQSSGGPFCTVRAEVDLPFRPVDGTESLAQLAPVAVRARG